MHNCLDKLPSPCAFPVPDTTVFRQRPIARVVEIALVLEATRLYVQLTYNLNIFSTYMLQDRGDGG
jgi:hypothetical protein